MFGTNGWPRSAAPTNVSRVPLPNGTRETLNKACVARLPCAVLGLCAYG